MKPERLLQFIASGALGERAFEGGRRTAALGLAFHFAIGTIASTLYYAASSVFHALPRHPLIFGILFGVIVELVMGFIVVPLSRAPKVRPTIRSFAAEVLVNVFCVGLRIAVVQSFLSLDLRSMYLWSTIAG